MKRKLILQILLLTISIFFLSSCGQKYFYEKEITIHQGKWDRDSLIYFNIPITDTISTYDIYLSITNGNEYLYRNIYLFVKIYFPQNITRIDTIDCLLANDKGKWFGKKIDDNRFRNLLLYRKNIKFPFKGSYKFSFEQAMRHKILSGIYNIGLYIKKVEKP